MWKAAFTGRSEVGSTSSRKKASGNESGASNSSRKVDDEKRRSEKSRGGEYNGEDSGSAIAPSSRNGEPRALTQSAVRTLDNDDEWEDENKEARSERRSVKSDRRKDRKKGDTDRSRSRSRSRDRGSDQRGTRAYKESKASRGASRAIDEGDSRAIPDMGSFEQFPGQYASGVMGDAGQPEFMMSGGISSSADNQFGLTRADTFGAAADYYLDEGQSVHDQPGFRAKSPNMLVNPDQHLMAASAEAHPAEDTGHGSAADFYGGKTSPVPFETPSGKPGKQSSGSSKISRPGRTSSLGTGAALGAAASAAGMAMGLGSSHNSQSQSQSQYQTSSTSGKPPGGSGSMSSSRPPRKPSRNNSAPVTSGSDGAYYGPPPQQQQPNSTNSGKPPSNSKAGLYATGAAAAVGAAGLAAYEMHEHNKHEQQQNQQQQKQESEYRASSSQYSGASYGRPPSYGPPPGLNQGRAPSLPSGVPPGMPPGPQSGPQSGRPLGPRQGPQSGEFANGMGMNSYPFHEHKGPMTRLKDGLLNLVSSEEDVMKMEMYTEYIGVCKYCFDPRTSPYDAPRIHHYHTSSRRDSFEDLRKRRSMERLRRNNQDGLNRTPSNRVDKDSRYYSSDAARRRKSSDKIGLVGAGLATAGAVAGANALFNDRKDFDDTYSVKSGHRESSAVRRRSRSSSREKRGKATYGVVGKDSNEEYVTVRTKDGRVERRKVRRRSRSNSKDRTNTLATAATAAALGGAAIAATNSRTGRRQSPKRSHRSRSSSRSDNQQGFFGGFFSPSRNQKRRESPTGRKRKEGGFFNFGNGSASSDHDLAFGASRTDLPLRRKSSIKSTKRKNSDEHIAATVAGIGVTAAALAAAQNGRRVNHGTGRPELGARRHVQTTPLTGPEHRPGSPGDSEGEWQDEDELPSDVDDASSAGSDLAFGGHRPKLSKRQSADSLSSRSSTGGFLGWRWGRGRSKNKQRKSSEPSASYQSRPDSSVLGSAAAGVAAGAATAGVIDASDKLRRTESGVTSSSSIPQRPMQEIDPRPMSESGSIPGSQYPSMPGAFDAPPPTSRPGPGPIQQPKPISPIQPAFTQSPPEMSSPDVTRPNKPRRTQSSPTRSNFMEDAALIGAAAIGTAGIIASQSKKSKDSNVRWGLTEEQERKHELEQRREQEKTNEERRRADRERAIKEEAARYSREQDVLRAREEENRKAAEAKLERQRRNEEEAARAREEEKRRADEADQERRRTAQREADRQAELSRQREREQRDREEAYNREQARRAEEDARQQEQLRWQREQDEKERRQRERDEQDRKQREWESQQRDEPRRETGERRQYDQRDQESYRPGQNISEQPAQDSRRKAESESQGSSVPWGAVATGVAAAGAGAFALHEYDQREKRQQDARRDYPVRDESVDSPDEYRVQEIEPPADHPSVPIDDDDIYNPESFRRGNRSASDYARHAALARRAAEKVVAADNVVSENDVYYNEPWQSQAEFFRPEILDKTPTGKEKVADPLDDNRSSVRKSPDDEAQDLFEREWAVSPQGRTKYAPFGVPKLGLVSPTPPPPALISPAPRRPSSPLAASEAEEPRGGAEDGAGDSSSRNRVSWGVDQTHVYDAQTPEHDHEHEPSYMDHRDDHSVAEGTAAAAGVAVGAAAVYEAAHSSSRDSEDRRTQDRKDVTMENAIGPQDVSSSYEQSVRSSESAKEPPHTEKPMPAAAYVEDVEDETVRQEEQRRHIPGGFDDEYDDSQEPAYVPASESHDIVSSSSGVDRQDAKDDRPEASSTQEEVADNNGETVEEEEEEAASRPPMERKLSKKEKRKREKAAMRSGSLGGEETPPPINDDATASDTRDQYPLERVESSKKGKKGKKQGFADVAEAMMTTGDDAPASDTLDQDVLARTESSKKNKKGKKQGFGDVAEALMTTGGLAAIAAEASSKSEESKSSKNKKGKKSKRDSRSYEPSEKIPPNEEEPPSSAMPGGWGSDGGEKEVNPSSEVVESSNEQAPEDWQPSFPPTAKAPPVTSVQEATATLRRSSRESRSPADTNGYEETEGRARSHSAASEGLAATAAAMYGDSPSRPSEKDVGDQQPAESENRVQTEDSRLTSSDPYQERDRKRPYDEDEARQESRYYDEPESYDRKQKTASESYDGRDSSRKSKRRSRREDDEVMSVASSGSRRERESSESTKRDKKSSFFGGMFGRKSADSASAARPDGDSLSRHSTRESRDEAMDDGERRHRRRRYTDSENREDDDYDDTRSEATESRRKHHRRRTDDGDDYESSRRDVDGSERHHHRRRTDDGDDYESSRRENDGSERHHHRRRTNDDEYESSRRDDESSSRHHHRRRTDDETYDRDESFLGDRVEDMPPLPGNLSASADSASIKQEQEHGMPASAEPDTELASRQRADAFELIRQDEDERPAADAFDLIRHEEHERPPAGAFDLIRHDQIESAVADSSQLAHHVAPEEETMEVDAPEAAAREEQATRNSSDVEMRDFPSLSDSWPTSPTALAEKETPERRISVNRPISTTAVPLRFPFGPHPPTPSPRMDRSASFGGFTPVSPATPGSSQKTRQGRPMSSEMRPLYIVERNRKTEEVDEGLPSLPSSKPSSRASSQVGSDDYESAQEDFASPGRRKPLTIDTDRASSYTQEPDYLDSQQTTPRASEPPKPILDRPPRQEPQFYTWEDFAQDERMRMAAIEDEHQHSTAENEAVVAAERSKEAEVFESEQGSARYEELPPLPSSRPESPTLREDDHDLSQGIATAAVLGGAALLAHQTFKGGEERQEDLNVAAKSSTAPVPRDVEHTAALDSLMEEGKVSGDPEPIKVAPTPEPNELDRFLQDEEDMEEGRMDTENVPDHRFNNDQDVEMAQSAHATSGHEEPMSRVDESTERFNRSEDLMESGYVGERTQSMSAIEPLEPVPTIEESAAPAQPPSSQPREEADDKTVVDDNSAAKDTIDPSPVMDYEPKISRKQSKKSKKNKRTAARQASLDKGEFREDVASEPVEETIEDLSTAKTDEPTQSYKEDKEDTIMAAPAARDADDGNDGNDDVPSKAGPSTERGPEREFEDSASNTALLAEVEEQNTTHPTESLTPAIESVDMLIDEAQDAKTSSQTADEMHNAQSVEDPMQEPPKEEALDQPGAEESLEQVPFLTRKKSKKDKKKQRQQALIRESQSSSTRDNTVMEMETADPDAITEAPGPQEAETSLKHEDQRKSTPVEETRVPQTSVSQNTAVDAGFFEGHEDVSDFQAMDVGLDDALSTSAPTRPDDPSEGIAKAPEGEEKSTSTENARENIDDGTRESSMPHFESNLARDSLDLVSTAPAIDTETNNTSQSGTTEPESSARDSHGFAESAPSDSNKAIVLEESRPLEEEPSEEFSWTSSSKKKGKKGKKGKKSTFSSFSWQETPEAKEEFDEQGSSRQIEQQNREDVEIAESTTRDESHRLPEQYQPLEVEDAKVGSTSQAGHEASEKAAAGSEAAPHDHTDALERDAPSKDPDFNESKAVEEHSVPGAFPGVEEPDVREPSVVATPPDHQTEEFDSSEQPVESELPKEQDMEQQLEMIASIEEPEVARDTPKEDDEQRFVGEEERMDTNRAEEAVGEMEIKSNVPAAPTEFLQDETPLADDEDAQEADAFWAPKQSRKKDKKSKKSKKSAKEEALQAEPAEIPEGEMPSMDRGSPPQPSAEHGNEERQQSTGMEDVQFETPPPKGKKGKNSKKAASVEKDFPEASSAYPEIQQDDVVETSNATTLDTAAGNDAMNVDPADFWQAPVKKKSKKGKKGKQVTIDETSDPPKEQSQHAGETELEEARGPTAEMPMLEDNNEMIASAASYAEAATTREMDSAPSGDGATQEVKEVPAAMPEPSNLETDLDVMAVDEAPSQPQEESTITSEAPFDESIVELENSSRSQDVAPSEPEKTPIEQSEGTPSSGHRDTEHQISPSGAEDMDKETISPKEDEQKPVKDTENAASKKQDHPSLDQVDDKFDIPFVVKKSKKDKKGKKSRSSWANEPSEEIVPEPSGGDVISQADQTLMEGTAGAAIVGSALLSNEATKEADEEEDWSGFSRKRSKKDKKKSKKKDSITPTATVSDSTLVQSVSATEPDGSFAADATTPSIDQSLDSSKMEPSRDLVESVEIDHEFRERREATSTSLEHDVPMEHESAEQPENPPTEDRTVADDALMHDAHQEPSLEPLNVAQSDSEVHDLPTEKPSELHEVLQQPTQNEVLTQSPSESVPKAQEDAEHDIDFTATVAAALADSGFDSNIVVDDPAFQRRASPPRTIAEADPEEIVWKSSKRKKSKKENKLTSSSQFAADEQEKPGVDSAAPKSSADDFNETLEKTLSGMGFDPSLVQRAASDDDTTSNEITGDSAFIFTTSKKKKSKRSKDKGKSLQDDVDSAALLETDEIPTLEVQEPEILPENRDKSASHTDAREDTVDSGRHLEATDISRNAEPTEDNATLDPVQSSSMQDDVIEPDLALAGEREMDVDEMDNAYRAFKKNKRNKKKQKAAASQSESVSETDQREEGLQSAQTPPKEEQASAFESDAKIVPEPIAQTQSETRDTDAPYQRDGQDLEPTAITIRDSESSVPWSFATLEDQGVPQPESPVFEHKEHELVRDSGYEEGNAPQLQRRSRDSYSSRGSAVRTSQSLERQHQSSPGEVPDIAAGAAAGLAAGAAAYWDLHQPKTRNSREGATSDTVHSRTQSRETNETLLESTTTNRTSYLFQTTPENLRESVSGAIESPTPGARSTSSEHSRGARGETSHRESKEISSDYADEGGYSSGGVGMLSPKSPLHTIHEERHGQKRAIGETDVTAPESAKSIRMSHTPPSARASGDAFSTTSLPPITTHSHHTGSMNSPLPMDHRGSRSPSSSTHEGRESSLGAALSNTSGLHRQPSIHHARSPSAMSNRSNASAGFKSPEELRSYSRASNRSSTPTLRRTSLSGDLRAASRRGDTGSSVGARSSPKTIPFEPPPTPPLNDDEVMDTGASRSVNMSDVYQGYGDAAASQTSPTRPPSMRKRQSMHIMELESKLDQLTAENEALQQARGDRGITGEALQTEEESNLRDLQLREKDNEINQIRTMLQTMQDEIDRLNEINAGLTEANRSIVDDNNGHFANLQAEHAHAQEQWQSTSRELENVKQEHGKLTSDMREVVEAEIATALADKNSEIRQLREELDVATERIRALQVQIQSTRSRDFITTRDEDYFDGACQKLCQHVQQWVLRFSKLSDDRHCRMSTDLNDDKVESRLDNVVLDGSDVDKLLGDRIKRRDVFMSLVMTMVWEYVFTRYLFGMDREQRKKLKDLEKMLDEVGPKRAVAQWRATTLTLLSKRPAFYDTKDQDTEAVAGEIFSLLCRLLPPPSSAEQQLLTSLQRVVGIAVDLSIEMRCQRAEYIMLPPLQPEYDTNGDLAQKVFFNASLMNERSGTFSSNGELEQSMAVVKIVLFPLVVKKGDESGEGEEEIVVCPAQVLVQNENGRGKRIVRVQSGAMEIDDPRRSQQSLVSAGASTAI